MRYFPLLFLLFFQLNLNSQNSYGLIQGSQTPRCTACINIINTMPSEVLMSIRVDEAQRMYFIMSDVDWYRKLFSTGSMGIAVDMLGRRDFECGNNKSSNTAKVARGKLTEPVYYKTMKEKEVIAEDGTVTIDLGPLPEELVGKEHELNLLILNKKMVCYYTAFYNIKRYKWALLRMGLYTDTIIYEPENFDSIITIQKFQSSIINKKITFIVPFEKNKYNYTKEDIKPLYDSMSLNLYDIKRIQIRAYASVEGSKVNNIRLQENRAKSIVNSLQEFQSEEIVYDISSAENWVEFNDDIKGTEFESMGDLSKEAVKKKLLNKAFSAKMEYILGRHRKAVITIEIEKKTAFKNISEEQIIIEFDKSIRNKDQSTAEELLNLAYQRVAKGESPNKFLGKLEVPKQKEYGLLYNRSVVFQYFAKEKDVITAYEDFIALKELIPKSKEVNYNIVSLKFKLWLIGSDKVNPETFIREIKALTLYGVSSKLINRMLINYNIIQSEKNMFVRDYKAKDKNVKYIYSKYKTINPNPEDILKLAQYFVAYRKYDWATNIIKPYIGKVDTDENLLFYYINLTVIDPKTYESRPYKKILLNAIDVNNERFCKLFNSSLEDGISMQLLDVPILQGNYCESCK